MSEIVISEKQVRDLDIAEQILRVYKDSFAETELLCAQDQICYDDHELTEALLDPEYLKFVVLVDNEVIGFCLLTNNLKKARIAYCNDRFLRNKFPKFTQEGKLYYVTAICILPDRQRAGYGVKLLEQVIKFIDDTDSMVSFDYSEGKNPALPEMVVFVAKNILNIDIAEIPLDQQCYTSLYGLHNTPPG